MLRIDYKMVSKVWCVLIFLLLQQSLCNHESLEPGQCLSRFDYDFKVMQKLSELEQEIKELKEKKTNEGLLFL